MTPRRTIIGELARSRFASPWTFRAVCAVLVLVFGVLILFPERYRAAVTLTPTDPASLGLSGTLNQLGAINSVFGNQTAVEVALKVARSVSVRESAAKRTKLMQRMNFDNWISMQRWLERQVSVRSLRGGIILFETYQKDPELGRDIIAAYAAATRENLAEINRRQTEYKRDVLLKLVRDASDRLAIAQSNYNEFRLHNRFALPEEQMQAIGSRVPALQAAIKAKEVDLAAARRFGTDRNFNVQQLEAQLGELKQQLVAAKQTSPADENSVGRIVQTSTQLDKLQRELKIAQTLYYNYLKYLEGTSVEDLTSTASVRILEQPFVDTDRQINYTPLALAIAILLLWGAVEFYRLRPPVGDRAIRESHA